MVRLTKSSPDKELISGISDVWEIVEVAESIKKTDQPNFTHDIDQNSMQVDQYLKRLEWIDQWIFTRIWPDDIFPPQYGNLLEIHTYTQDRIKYFRNKPISTKNPALLQRVRCLILASENKRKIECFKELLPLLISITDRGIEGQDGDDIFARLRNNYSNTPTPTDIDLEWMLIPKNQYDETLGNAIEKADCIFYIINRLNFKDTNKMITDLVEILQSCTNNQNIEILLLHNTDDAERFSVYEFLRAKLLKCYYFRRKFLNKNRWRMWSLKSPCYSEFKLPLEWACCDILRGKAEGKEPIGTNMQEKKAILSEYFSYDPGSWFGKVIL